MKKAVAMFLALALMAASLTACGNDSKGSNEGGSTNGGTEADNSGTDQEDAGDEGDAKDDGGSASAAGGETFNIGGIGPITGGTSIYGLAVRNGAQIAVDEINEAGGINGVQIAYDFQDDESDAEKAVNAYNTLKDWGKIGRAHV